MWDLLLRGGHVIDPATGRNGRADIAVRHGRVAAVAEDLPREEAIEVADVHDRVVTPGLVDMHTHVWHGAGFWSLDPDPIAWRTGVTTWIDAGSAGAYSMDGLHRFVADAARVRIAALINVSAIGLVAETGEHHALDNLDLDTAATVAARHGDFVRGVKARIDSNTVGSHGMEPLRRAVALARRIERPLMVHVGYGPPTIGEIVPLLGEGDILTHCASGCPTDLVNNGRLGDAARRALEAGVVFDIGHGSGGFAFDVLEAELASGVRPIVSSDLHVRSAQGPVFDLPTVMSKMTATGWSLYDTVEAATIRPARAMGLDDLGTLHPGAVADLAVFSVERGRFPVVDTHGDRRDAPLRLTNTATYVNGRLLPPSTPEPTPPWIPQTDGAREAEKARIEQTRVANRPDPDRAGRLDRPLPRGGARTSRQRRGES